MADGLPLRALLDGAAGGIRVWVIRSIEFTQRWVRSERPGQRRQGPPHLARTEGVGDADGTHPPPAGRP
jgi:hypothetical protein